MYTSKNSFKAFTFLALLAIITSLLAGCGGSKVNTPDKVTMQFAWFHQIEYAGFYVAVEKGYYAEENIDANLVAGGYEANAIKSVMDGSAQFGISRGTNMTIARSEGKDVVAVGTIFRKSPWVAVSLKKAGITKPQDLAGKTIGIETGDPKYIENVQFLALLKKLNVDASAIKYMSRDFADPIANDLKAGKADVDAGLFSTNDLVTAQMRGDEVNTIFYSDYGIDIYANLIFANGDFLKKNPDLAKRFMRATLRGYQYAIEHPDEAVAATLKYDEKLDAKVQAAQMAAQIPLIDTGDQPIGWMDEGVWQNTADLLLNDGFIPSAVDAKSLFSNDFITK